MNQEFEKSPVPFVLPFLVFMLAGLWEPKFGNPDQIQPAGNPAAEVSVDTVSADTVANEQSSHNGERRQPCDYKVAIVGATFP